MYKIKEIDASARRAARRRWNEIAKPLHGMGVFEDIITDIAGIQGTQNVSIDKRAVLIMCADNGVTSENVSQTTSDVTAVVTENFAKGKTSVCAMAHRADADIIAVDVGVKRDVEGVTDRKISYGTRNMLRERAMTRGEAQKAIETGIECVKELCGKGYKIIVTGEMGIGNTTTASAVTSVLLDKDVKSVTGRGAGLSSEGLTRKTEVIEKAIRLHRPDKNDVLDVLSAVGGYDIAALAGVFIGGGVYGVPIVIDGFISAAAALCAHRLTERCRDFMVASHVSGERASRDILKILGKKAPIDADMRVGEGTGGVMLLTMLDAALGVYRDMVTFDEINIERYKELK